MTAVFTIAYRQKKNKMSPAKRRELSESLNNKSAIIVRNKLVNESMSIGDTDPSILPTTVCLRQIKYEYKQRQYYHSHPFLALWSMTTVYPYNVLIRHIALYPFFALLVTCSRTILTNPIQIKTNYYDSRCHW